jgi:hypothetical protein
MGKNSSRSSVELYNVKKNVIFITALYRALTNPVPVYEVKKFWIQIAPKSSCHL